jgi:hypothetical protein
MTSAQFVTSAGHSMFIQTRVRLRFGFAAFLGTSNASINMLEAAQASLQRSLEINSPELFQNIFIEWTTVGDVPVSTPLLEKVVI